MSATSTIDARWGNDDGDHRVISDAAPGAGVGAPLHRAWLADYWNHLCQRVVHGEVTRLSQMAMMNSAEQWTGWLEGQHLDTPKTDDLRVFLDGLTSRTHDSRHTMLTHLKTFYTWVSQSIDMDPTKGVHLTAPDRRGIVRECADLETVRRLVASISPVRYVDRRNRALLWLLASGAETIQLHRANVEDLHLDSTVLHATRRKTMDRVALIAVLPDARADLTDYLALHPADHGTPLFGPVAPRTGCLPAGWKGKRLTMLSMRLTVQHVLEHAGIVTRDEGGNLIDPGRFGTGFLARGRYLNKNAAEAMSQGLTPLGHWWDHMRDRVVGYRAPSHEQV